MAKKKKKAAAKKKPSAKRAPATKKAAKLVKKPAPKAQAKKKSPFSEAMQLRLLNDQEKAVKKLQGRTNRTTSDILRELIGKGLKSKA